MSNSIASDLEVIDSQPADDPETIPFRARDGPQRSREYALDNREFEQLLEATYSLDDYYALQARFVVLVGGRMGLRPGEIVHLCEDWIDWREQRIEIPAHQPCDKGRNGGVCGYCRQLAEQRVAYNDDVDLEQALQARWHAKTENAIRSVPFDFDPRCELVMERFFDRFEEFPVSKTGLNRRLDRALEAADELDVDDCRPNGLRATAASYHSGLGLDHTTLKSLMGWAQFSTATNYVEGSGERTQRALLATHSR